MFFWKVLGDDHSHLNVIVVVIEFWILFLRNLAYVDRPNARPGALACKAKYVRQSNDKPTYLLWATTKVTQMGLPTGDLSA